MSNAVDWTNNSIQRELKDASIQAWELNSNTYNKGIISDKSSRYSHGTYWEYNKAFFLSSQVVERQPGTVTPIAKYQVSKSSFVIPQFHLGVAVTNEEIVEASDVLDPMMDAADFLGNNFIVDYEVDFANTFVADDVWEYQAVGQAGATTLPIDGDVTLDVADADGGRFQQFDQLTSSDPIEIFKQCIRTVQKETGLRLNKLLIPRIVFDKIMNNDNVKQWAANTIGINGGDMQTKAILKQNMDFAGEIHIIEMSYQTITSIAYANRDTQDHNFGQTSTPTFGEMEWVLNKSCLFMYTDPRSTLGKYSKTAAACMKWDGLIDTMTNVSGVRRGEFENSDMAAPNLMIRGRYDEVNFTNYVEGYFAYDNNVIVPNLGFYLKDCIA